MNIFEDDSQFNPDAMFLALEASRKRMIETLKERDRTDLVSTRALNAAYKIHRFAPAPEGRKPLSVDDAWVLARAEPTVIERQDTALEMSLAYDDARSAFDLLVKLADWRQTQEASLRKMRV